MACLVNCVGRREVEKGFSHLESFVMADAAAGRVKKSGAGAKIRSASHDTRSVWTGRYARRLRSRWS